MTAMRIATAALALATIGCEGRRERLQAEEPLDTASLTATPPIVEEAAVFRSRGFLASLEPFDERRRAAHPRTLATYRALRAYPGAPPRIPHGLTAKELRDGTCNSCHASGSFSQRFGAYAPVTPHPELTECLQCHVADASVAGIALPSMTPDALCGQCHTTGGRGATGPALDWVPATWPRPVGIGATGAPPTIPHDLLMRGNCVACHGGAAAVDELRTDHPERTDCRQCHVTQVGDDPAFTRPAGSPPGGGNQ